MGITSNHVMFSYFPDIFCMICKKLGHVLTNPKIFLKITIFCLAHMEYLIIFMDLQHGT